MFSRLSLLLPVSLFLSFSYAAPVVGDESQPSLPKKSEWLPGVVKRDENGQLYLHRPEAKTATNRPTVTASPRADVDKTKVLYKNWVTLSWPTAKTGAGGRPLSKPLGHRIYYWRLSNPEKLMRDAGTASEYRISDLDYGETYFFAVTSYDDEGNESVFSKVISARLEEPPENK